MNVFRRVLELRSFSAAARDLRLSNAAVSKHVASLEERLRVRLLHRTTRRVAATPAGDVYYQRCTRLLDDLVEAEQSISSSGSTPHGLLRVNAPVSFGVMHVAPLLPAFLQRWPDIKVELTFDDRFIDLVEEGVDVAIRVGYSLPDSATLVAQRLARTRHVLCATPRFLRAHGAPACPADLARFNCIGYSQSRTRGEWQFIAPDGPVRVPIKGNLEMNNSIAIREAVLGGVGIALLPLFYVEPWLRKKRLREVLAPYNPANLFVNAVYPGQRHLSARLRVFIDFLKSRLATASWAKHA